MLITSTFLHFLSELCLRPNQEVGEQPWIQTDLLLGMLSIWLFSKLLPGEVSTWAGELVAFLGFPVHYSILAV